MHTHAPKETFKLSRTKEREREIEKKETSVSRGESGRSGRKSCRSLLLFFLSHRKVSRVVRLCSAAPDSLNVSLSLWLLFVRFRFFFEAKISPFFFLLCFASEERIIRTSLSSTFSYSHTKTILYEQKWHSL